MNVPTEETFDGFCLSENDMKKPNVFNGNHTVHRSTSQSRCINDPVTESIHHSKHSEENTTVEKCTLPKTTRWISMSSFIYHLLYWLGTLYLLKLLINRLPLRTTSRIFGRLAKIRIPYLLRPAVFRSYGWLFEVKLDEVEHYDDLTRYDSISAFFQRSLRPSARHIDPHAMLISPADGSILSCGPVEAGHLEQVKGLFYSLHGLLGPNTWGEQMKTPRIRPDKRLVKGDSNSLHRRSRSTSTCAIPPVRSAMDLHANFTPCLTSQGVDLLPVYPIRHTEGAEHFVRGEKSTYRLIPSRHNKSSCAHSPGLRLKDLLYVKSLLLTQSGDLTDQSCGTKEEEEAERDEHDACRQQLPSIENISSPTFAEPFQKTRLYHVLIYLAPGDYHRFHSPTTWTIFMRRHFPGKLYPVSPSFLKNNNRLYCTNERVIYIGRWHFGFFAYVAVGSTNVGSIEVFHDPSLVTNVRTKRVPPPTTTTPIRNRENSQENCPVETLDTTEQLLTSPKSVPYNDLYFPDTVPMKKGDLFGQFNLGSTLILVFEAPWSDFKFSVKVGSQIRVGEPIGSICMGRDSRDSNHTHQTHYESD